MRSRKSSKPPTFPGNSPPALPIRPRKMVKFDNYYGPEPRKLIVIEDEEDEKRDDVLLLK